MFPKSANVKRVKHVKHINMLIPLTFRSSIKSFHRAAEHARRLLTAFRAARRLLTDYWHSFVTRESMRGACSLAYRQSRGFGGKGAGNPDLAESWTPPLGR